MDQETTAATNNKSIKLDADLEKGDFERPMPSKRQVKGRSAALQIGTLSDSVKFHAPSPRRMSMSSSFFPATAPSHQKTSRILSASTTPSSPTHHRPRYSAPVSPLESPHCNLLDDYRPQSAAFSRSGRAFPPRPVSPNPTMAPSTNASSSLWSRPGTPNLNPGLTRVLVQKGSKVTSSLSKYFHRMNLFTNTQLDRFDWKLAACSAIPVTAKDKELAIQFEQKRTIEKGRSFGAVAIDSDGMPVEDYATLTDLQALELQRFSMRIQLRKKKQKVAAVAAEEGADLEDIAAGPKKSIIISRRNRFIAETSGRPSFA